ncbi:putative iron-sulfur cluster-binding metallochaperone [Photobacterium satsumensis]|uniref:putative iron-sulfur cluster-binding metallochaperone n=1 Tax=Photobacterium satsumensis TaxID=2910239 RepID=UPI003D09EDA7
MSGCCSTSCQETFIPRKHICPVNGKAYSQVSKTTIKHHIKAPWEWVAKEQGYYFCSDPDCDVVYFGQDNSVINTSEVRTKVGVKDQSASALICYCYGITKNEAENNPLAQKFVVEETKQKNCACTTKNPAGRCCLASFPKK